MDELPDAGCMLCNTARHTGTIWFVPHCGNGQPAVFVQHSLTDNPRWQTPLNSTYTLPLP